MSWVIEAIDAELVRHNEKISLYYGAGHLGSNYYVHLGSRMALQNLRAKVEARLAKPLPTDHMTGEENTSSWLMDK